MADTQCCCTIDLQVIEDTPITWGATEYIPMVSGTLPEYEGPYEATPTASAQTFDTAGKLMVREFTVNPIPSNWGLITWNGSVLTVS